MKPFDFGKEISNFFISNSFLFTKYNGKYLDYVSFFFPDQDQYLFRIPFDVKPDEIIHLFKENVIQTYQISMEGSLSITTIFQINKQEHIVVSYFPKEEKFAGSVLLVLKDPSRVPFWMDRLQNYQVNETQKKFVGFSQH